MVTDDWHKLHDNILRCRRVLVQNGIVKHPPHEEIGFLRSAFNRWWPLAEIFIYVAGLGCEMVSHSIRPRARGWVAASRAYSQKKFLFGNENRETLGDKGFRYLRFLDLEQSVFRASWSNHVSVVKKHLKTFLFQTQWVTMQFMQFH